MQVYCWPQVAEKNCHRYGGTMTTKLAEWLKSLGAVGAIAVFFTVGLLQIFSSLPSDPATGIVHRARQGNAEDQFALGIMYLTGDRLGQSVPKAIEWLHSAAMQGHSDAQLTLGDIYLEDWEFLDLNLALHWLKQSAAQGNSLANFKLGKFYGSGDSLDEEKSASYYISAAESGHSLAQAMVGVFFDIGWGVVQDREVAVGWFTKAASQGEPAAQCALGHIYSDIEYPGFDINIAIEYYTKSARQGYSAAQLALGELHEKDEENPANLVLAASWYQLAARSGNGYAKARYREIAGALSKAELKSVIEFCDNFQPIDEQSATQPLSSRSR